jgi:hypothetical protein
VAFAPNVANDFKAVGKTHLGDFTQGRVRLFGRRGVDACANTAALRAVLQGGAFAFDDSRFSRLAHQLVDGRHFFSVGARCAKYGKPASLKRAERAVNTSEQHGIAP